MGEIYVDGPDHGPNQGSSTMLAALLSVALRNETLPGRTFPSMHIKYISLRQRKQQSLTAGSDKTQLAFSSGSLIRKLARRGPLAAQLLRSMWRVSQTHPAKAVELCCLRTACPLTSISSPAIRSFKASQVPRADSEPQRLNLSCLNQQHCNCCQSINLSRSLSLHYTIAFLWVYECYKSQACMVSVDPALAESLRHCTCGNRADFVALRSSPANSW